MHHLVGCDQQQDIGHSGDEDGRIGSPSQGQTRVQPGAAMQQGAQRRQAEGGPGSLAGGEGTSEAPHLSTEITIQGCSGQRRLRFRGEKHRVILISSYGRHQNRCNLDQHAQGLVIVVQAYGPSQAVVPLSRQAG